jgi:hypothetical protein
MKEEKKYHDTIYYNQIYEQDICLHQDDAVGFQQRMETERKKNCIHTLLRETEEDPEIFSTMTICDEI